MSPANDTMVVVDFRRQCPPDHRPASRRRVNYADYPLSEYESGHLDVGGTGSCKVEIVRRTFQVKNSDFSECFYDPAQQVVRLPWFDIVCAILRR
jgi:hypothetical protein